MYTSLVLLVQMCCILGSCAKITYRRNFQFSNQTLNDLRYDRYRSRRKDITSASECAVWCSVLGCKTFYYDPNKNVCITFITMMDHVFPMIGRHKTHFVQILGDCNSGWDHYGNMCIFFGDKKLSWYQAKGECRKLNGTLVRADSKDKNAFLKQKARIKGKSFWIGGSAKIEKKKKHWIWADGSPLNGYTDWASIDPSQGPQTCLQLWSYARWSWDDDYCSVAKPYICESPVLANKNK